MKLFDRMLPYLAGLLFGTALLIAIVAATRALADEPPGRIIVIPLGDVDCSGRVDVVDALLILQFDAGRSSPRCIRRGDVDNDGRVNSGDAVRVLFYAAGLSRL